MAKIIEPNLAVNKKDSEQDKRLRELKNMTLPSTLAQAGGSVKSRGETCRQLRRGETCRQLRLRQQNWDRNNWKTISWNSKHSSWSDDS